ncbi:MAG: bifunctional nicotinamidase/pyrazinamidase [Pseudomonadota bacterium]
MAEISQTTDALLVIDVQNDFCPGGTMEVDGGDEVVPIINRLGRLFDHVIVTQDWHPAGHSSFASTDDDRAAYETVEMHYGQQVLWPDHCIQGTDGAALHADLDIPHAELLIRKGFRSHVDSYSAFFENDHKTPTGLRGYLSERGFKRLFVAGLAYDFCVRYSSEDAVATGFEAVVIKDACRSIALPGTVEDAEASFDNLGIVRIEAADLESSQAA